MFYLGRILFILAGLFWVVGADAQKIRTDQITPSTTLTEHRRFPLSQINDGSTLNSSPYNGFQSNAQRGTITFTLDKPYDVTAFLLWNDVNVRLEGVKSFELEFFDENDQQLYRLPETRTKTVTDVAGKTLGVVDVQRFDFPVVKNTKRIDLIVKTVFTEYPRNPIKRIEIREVEFEGFPSRIDRPPSWTTINKRIKIGETIYLEPRNFIIDPDGDAISIIRANRSNSGRVAVLRPINNRIGITGIGPIGNDSFSYTFKVGQREYIGQVDVVVWKDTPPPVDKPPVVKHHDIEMYQGIITTFDPLFDDRDPEGKSLSISGFAVPPRNIDINIQNNKLKINAGKSLGRYDFVINVTDGRNTVPSDITIRVKKRGYPWWVWPLGGGLVVMGGLIAFLLKGRATAAPVEAASTTTRIAGRASDSLRRIFRTDLKFRKDEGVPFGKSPLIATAIEPGPEPRLPVGHEIPAGLATLTGPFFVLREAYRATGRIGFAQEGVPTNDDVSLGTGFVIAPNLIMTNQHVYQAYKHYLEGDECGGIEFIAERDRDASDYYEFDGNPPIVLPDLDIAIFRTKKKIIGRKPLNRVYVPTDDLLERDVIVVGYPCPFEVDDYILSLVEPDPIFAIKRVTQGKVFRHSTDSDGPFGILFKVDALINGKEEMSAVCHNATTLAGNSGSPVLCAKTGKLLGVHFAGSRSLFGQEAANLAMAIEAILEKEEEEEF